MSKIEDFGVHANQYYSLDVSFFKSGLDARVLDVLWNKYWVNTLSSSPLRTNRAFIGEQLSDLARKMDQAESHAAQAGRIGGLRIGGAPGAARMTEQTRLRRVALDGAKVTVEQAKGAATHILKDAVFNRREGVVARPENEMR
jgi:COP9 signalosome complex subunit 5